MSSHEAAEREWSCSKAVESLADAGDLGREALRDAIAAFEPELERVTLDSPATPERVFWAVKKKKHGNSSWQLAAPIAAGSCSTVRMLESFNDTQ